MQNIKMRVVGGKYARRQIVYNSEAKNIRPTKDMVREGLFSALGFDIKGCRVLDLFAGTGALGIEAISRGALSATFVDKSKEALDLIEKNTAYIEEEVITVASDYENFLRKYEGAKFDLVLLDPPYSYDLVDIFSKIIEAKITNNNAIYVLESDKPLSISFEGSKIKTYKYGITYITIIWRSL